MTFSLGVTSRLRPDAGEHVVEPVKRGQSGPRSVFQAKMDGEQNNRVDRLGGEREREAFLGVKRGPFSPAGV